MSISSQLNVSKTASTNNLSNSIQNKPQLQPQPTKQVTFSNPNPTPPTNPPPQAANSQNGKPKDNTINKIEKQNSSSTLKSSTDDIGEEVPANLFVLCGNMRIGSGIVSAFEKTRFKSKLFTNVNLASVQASPYMRKNSKIEFVKLEDIENTSNLKIAFTNIERLFIVLPEVSNRVQVASSIFKAAKEAGVRFILLLSVFQPQCKQEK